MDLNQFFTGRIKQLQDQTKKVASHAQNSEERSEITGYLRALDECLEIIKLAKDAARLEQQLARKQDLMDQPASSDWSHIGKAKQAAISEVPANNNHGAVKSVADRLAA